VSIAYFEKVGRLVLSLMIVALCAIVVGRDLIVSLLGPSYREASVLFPLVCVVPVFATISEVCGLGIPLSRKTYWSIVVSGIAAAIDIAGLLALVPLLGARGAAISIALSYMTYFWARFIISRNLWFKIRIWPYAVDTAFVLAINACVLSGAGSRAILPLVGICVVFNAALFVNAIR
jgi:O-antigen/teichoic acid export membrane protein